MVIVEQLIGERYRFREEHIPGELTQSQRDARKLFLDKIHKKKRYVSLSACPYCGNGTFRKISEVERRGLPSEIVICNSCDGCFKLTLLDTEANKYHYENISYALRGKEHSDEAIEKLFWDRVRLFAYPRYHFISHFIELNPDNDLIVEFGCNDGANLFPWHKKGFNVLGIELDPRMVEFGKQKGLNLIYEDLSNYKFIDKKPKLIILSHVLEHVTSVDRILDKLYEILQPEGYLFIEVPGIKVQGARDALRYFDVEHNYNFDLNSLGTLLRRHAFKILYGDEYIRLLCMPDINLFAPRYKFIPLSLNKIKAFLLKKFLEIISSKNKELYDLLKTGENNNFRIRVLNKLQILYFKYHYSAMQSNDKT